MDVALGSLIKQKVEEAMRDRGRATVLIAGRSGVGKSTLINAVFQGRLAETGQGRPVTKEIREYEKEGMPLSLIDTRGLELAKYAETLAELENVVRARQRESDPNRHVHCAWVCLSEDSRRVDPGETEIVEMLARNGVPVVVVVTKARSDQGFRAEVQRLLPKAGNVISVRAIHETLDEGLELPPKGLVELVELTMNVIPEGQKTAFVASQRVSLALKQRRARTIVASAAASAALVGATPIPFADATIIVPIQIGMLAGVSAAFGLELSEALLGTLLSSATGTLGATFAGRAIVGGLVKLIPGIGTVAGGALSGATAATITTTLGESYVKVLSRLLDGRHGDPPNAEEVGRTLREILAERRK